MGCRQRREREIERERGGEIKGGREGGEGTEGGTRKGWEGRRETGREERKEPSPVGTYVKRDPVKSGKILWASVLCVSDSGLAAEISEHTRLIVAVW